MKRVFISLGMRGKTDEEILEIIYKAIVKVRNKIEDTDIWVIDTFYTEFKPDLKPLEYLARSIQDLASADVVYFCKDWEEYRGCRIEHECAIQYEMNIIYE